jgi:hypothetical protein
MSQDRSNRDSETRALQVRLENWTPPEALPNPEPQDGWVFRWVRVGMTGESDMRNFSMRRREGWEPCNVKEHPEMLHLIDHDRRQGDEIVVGGLLLCKMPAEMADKRRQYFEQMAGHQMKAVDNSFFKEQDKRMPLFADRDSNVSFEFGKGTK